MLNSKKAAQNRAVLTDATVNHFDDIAESLITKICSYFDLNSYAVFGRCSKIIFSASQSPYSISKVHSDEILKYEKYCEKESTTIDANKFRKVSSLDIRIDLHELPHDSELLSFKFPNLLDLDLCIYDLSLNWDVATDNTEFLSKLITLQNVNFSSIQKLYLRSLPDDHHHLIHKILQNIEKLKYLRIQNDVSFHVEPNKNCVKTLEGLSIDNSRDSVWSKIHSNIIEMCNPGLLSLHFDKFREQYAKSINFHRFVHLTELCWTCDYDADKLIEFIEGFKQLKRLRLAAFPLYNDPPLWAIQVSEKFLTKLFMMNELEEVEIQILDYHSSRLIKNILFVMHELLMSSISNKKETFTLVIRPFEARGYDGVPRMPSNICIRLKSLIKTLETFVVKNWKLIFHVGEVENFYVNAIKQLFLKQSYKTKHVKKSDREEEYFVVSNGECLLYHEQWIWKCKNCSPY